MTVMLCVLPAATVPLMTGVMRAQGAPEGRFSTALACQLTATVLLLLSSVSVCGGWGAVSWARGGAHQSFWRRCRPSRCVRSS